MTFNNEVSEYVWRSRYAAPNDKTIEDTWTRLAATLGKDKAEVAAFKSLLSGFKFLPGGRIQTSVGSGREVTCFNCYVMDTISDSMADIFRVLQESAITQKMGGGVGYDFSTIRPKGFEVASLKSPAGGPLSFMHIFDATTKTIVGVGGRQGAQMGVMAIDHPDIEDFIHAKKGKENKALEKFNISVALSDSFMKALREGQQFSLTWNGQTIKKVDASALMESITRNAYDYAEPGVLFVDRYNQWNNLWYCETIKATNPCGEQGLPPHGACLLGSLNLVTYVKPDRSFDYEEFAIRVGQAVRLLDAVIDISPYPLEAQKLEAQNKRRMGIGPTGFASALSMMGLKYGSEECMSFIDELGVCLRDSAYGESVKLAQEKGPFPLFDKEQYLKGKFVKTLPKALREKIAEFGIRNSHLLSIAPCGTISLVANCVSSSIEPDFYKEGERKIKIDPHSDETKTIRIETYAYRWLKEQSLMAEANSLVTTKDVHPKTHIDVQARWQQYIDSSISKTINVEESYPYADFKDLYAYAYQKGCKGLTLYRPNSKLDSVVLFDHRNNGKSITLSDKMKRPLNLQGSTYKIPYKPSKGDLYITINRAVLSDQEKKEGKKERPFEVLISHDNSGETEVWIKSISKLLTAIMRRTDDLGFIIEAFENIRDSDGGQWWANSNLEDVKSALHSSDHVFLDELNGKSTYIKSGPHAIALALRLFYAQFNGNGLTTVEPKAVKSVCPSCGEREYLKESGCWVCQSCNYSLCN